MPKSKAKMPKRRQVARAQNPKRPRDARQLTERCSKAARVLPAWQLQPDFGTVERWQHGARTFCSSADNNNTVAARALEECVLDSLQVTGLLSPKLYVTGLQLRRDFVLAGLFPHQCSKYAAGTGEKVQYREYVRGAGAEAAYSAWRAALLAAGLHYSDVLVNVCCLGWQPQRHNMPLLVEGLQRLYRHYAALSAATPRVE